MPRPRDPSTAVDIIKDGKVVCTVEVDEVRRCGRVRVSYDAPRDVLVLRKNCKVFKVRR